MNKHVLFIDYENIHNIDLSLIQDHNLDVKIFVGKLQNKIPLEVVQTAQKFGTAVEWIQIEGNGSNALDFHIAFYLGKLSNANGNVSFIASLNQLCHGEESSTKPSRRDCFAKPRNDRLQLI